MQAPAVTLSFAGCSGYNATGRPLKNGAGSPRDAGGGRDVAATDAQIAALLTRNVELAERLIALREAKRTRLKLKRRQLRIVSAIGKQTIQAKTVAKNMGIALTSSLYDSLDLLEQFGILSHDDRGYTLATDYYYLLEDGDEEGDAPE